MSRVLAVDWGTRRLGLAISDPTGALARPLPILQVSSSEGAARGVVEAAAREGARSILVGLPLLPSGSEGASAREARRLGDSLRARGLDVTFADERWSTEDAKLHAMEHGEKRGPKGRLDQLAAVILLQSYLDSRAATAREPGESDHA